MRKFGNGTTEQTLYVKETGIRWNKTGVPTGERYRYLGDEDFRDENRYFFLDEGGYKTGSSRYRSERTQFTVNGTLAAQGTAEGTQYYTTDLFGSVAAVSDSSGYQLGSYTYDAFGNLLQGDLSGSTDFGYLGKQQDPNTRLYNYGYRDYSPQSARFTTVDPIRDGTNWFAYVNNDPVNFVDLWGLEVFYTIYRDPQSYDVSTDRDTPKNTYLDVGVLYNSNTNETIVFTRVQSVANYPSTDNKNNEVPSVYN
nr:RHS repeat-associated core domain-containing protein [Treponema sp.]